MIGKRCHHKLQVTITCILQSQQSCGVPMSRLLPRAHLQTVSDRSRHLINVYNTGRVLTEFNMIQSINMELKFYTYIVTNTYSRIIFKEKLFLGFKKTFLLFKIMYTVCLKMEFLLNNCCNLMLCNTLCILSQIYKSAISNF